MNSRYNDSAHASINSDQYIQTENINKPKGFISIDSRDRQPIEPVYKFRITKGETNATFNMSEVARIACETVSFFWTVPNINPRNNKIIWEQGGNEYTAEIPEGWYNHLTLGPAIQTAMNAQVAGSVVTVNGVEKGFSMSYTNAAPVIFKETGLNRDIIDITGWKRNISGVGFFGIVPDIYYTRYIDIISPTINTYQRLRDEDSNGKNTDLVVRIYTDDNERISQKKTYEPTNVFFVNMNPKWMVYVKSRELGEIEFRLLDEYGDFPYISPVFGSPEFIIQFQTES